MSRKRRFFVNALVSAAQVVVVGASLFVLYRFLLDTLGTQDFGVWALVLATTSATALANLGLAVSTVKFVSQYLARDDEVYVRRLTETAAVSVGALLAVLLPLLYPVLAKLLAVFIEPREKLPEALSILPYALVAFWFTSVGNVFASCLDGFQRIDLRGLIIMAATLTYLGLCFWLVPRFGLIGLAQAQVAQAALLFTANWVVLKRLLPSLPVLPYRWNRAAFKEMIGYSLNFQVIAFSSMLFEPVTKALVSKFGGVGVLAYFEMAHRMVFQLRNLLATAHQAVVPTIAEVKETNPALIRELYATSYRFILYVVLSSLPLLIALTPFIARLWIGHYEASFVVFATLLFVGWFFNLTTNPAYFANLGTGELRWNVWGHLLISVLNVSLGVLLGWAFGVTGVVVGFVTALVVGNLTIQLAYQHQYQIDLANLVDRETLGLGLAGLAGLGITLYLYDQFQDAWSLISLALLVIGVYGAIILLPLWKHPMRRHVSTWLATLQRRA